MDLSDLLNYGAVPTTYTTTITFEPADALATLATLGTGQQYVPAPTRELPSPTALSNARRRTSSFGPHYAPVKPSPLLVQPRPTRRLSNSSIVDPIYQSIGNKSSRCCRDHRPRWRDKFATNYGDTIIAWEDVHHRIHERETRPYIQQHRCASQMRRTALYSPSRLGHLPHRTATRRGLHYNLALRPSPSKRHESIRHQSLPLDSSGWGEHGRRQPMRSRMRSRSATACDKEC
jgi:hypothetical protein